MVLDAKAGVARLDDRVLQHGPQADKDVIGCAPAGGSGKLNVASLFCKYLIINNIEKVTENEGSIPFTRPGMAMIIALCLRHAASRNCQ